MRSPPRRCPARRPARRDLAERRVAAPSGRGRGGAAERGRRGRARARCGALIRGADEAECAAEQMIEAEDKQSRTVERDAAELEEAINGKKAVEMQLQKRRQNLI